MTKQSLQERISNKKIDRVIRVFVSSTFRDMQEEREILVKRVFPQLRKICEQRSVVWSEVDLRWGITDEQKSEGQVLPICLKEINRCRPYFIGLLGERYGWIPDRLPMEMVSSQPWLRNFRNRSITELEILHGVLNNPEKCKHAYFYLRDPVYIESLPAEIRKEYRESDSQSRLLRLFSTKRRQANQRRQLLQRLKQRIINSKFSVRKNYKNPEEFGNLVYHDMKELIDKVFPFTHIPTLPERETTQHEAFAAQRKQMYIYREEDYAQLDDYVKKGSQYPLVIVGEAGVGKSSLLANWVALFHQSNIDSVVIEHYVGCSSYSHDWPSIMQRIIQKLDSINNISIDSWSTPFELRTAFLKALKASGKRAKTILVIDGIEHLHDIRTNRCEFWFPDQLPHGVRLFLSLSDKKLSQSLTLQHWPKMKVKRLQKPIRERLIAHYLADYRKNLSQRQLKRIVAAESTGNPLFLLALLNELRVFGSHDDLDQQIQKYVECKSVAQLIDTILTRYEIDYNAGRAQLVRDTLRFLWASRCGLSETDILSLLGSNDSPLPRSFFAPFLYAVIHLLSDTSGLLLLNNPSVRLAVEHRYLSEEGDRVKIHLKLASYFDPHLMPSNQQKEAIIQQVQRMIAVKFRSALPLIEIVDPSFSSESTLTLLERSYRELPWQLANAQAWTLLGKWISRPECLAIVMEDDRFGVAEYWAQIEQNTQLRALQAYGGVLSGIESMPDDQANAVATLLADTGAQSSALAIEEKLAERFRRNGKETNLATSLLNQSNSLAHIGNRKEAIRRLSRAEIIFRQQEDEERIRTCLTNRGYLEMEMGHFDEALNLLCEAEKMAAKASDNLAHGRTILGKAILHIYQKDYVAAHNKLSLAEDLFNSVGDKRGLAVVKNECAMIEIEKHNFETATAFLEESECIHRSLGDWSGVQRCLGNKARVLRKCGLYKESLDMQEEAEQISRQIDDLEGIASALLNKAGILAQHFGRLADALPLAQKAYEIAKIACLPKKLEQQIKSLQQHLSTRVIDDSNTPKQPSTILPPSVAAVEGRMRNAIGDYKYAAQILEQAVAARPENAEWRSELSSSYMGLGRNEDAIAQLKQAVKLAPDYATAWYNLGSANFRQKNRVAAVSAYRRFLEIEPHGVESDQLRDMFLELS